ncbi:hypothetical protein [Chroococcidiopsis sp. CCALA 051]|uniref:hypothetical protein n=1 Tax=Chroococcidiopsis sp. CCALA 051 TaxID=869949 RepID=UPI001304DDB6|nr:hypothetical protein [Chroococcidiopsis sp. CCALA 051]
MGNGEVKRQKLKVKTRSQEPEEFKHSRVISLVSRLLLNSPTTNYQLPTTKRCC